MWQIKWNGTVRSSSCGKTKGGRRNQDIAGLEGKVVKSSQVWNQIMRRDVRGFKCLFKGQFRHLSRFAPFASSHFLLLYHPFSVTWVSCHNLGRRLSNSHILKCHFHKWLLGGWTPKWYQTPVWAVLFLLPLQVRLFDLFQMLDEPG